jgi:glycosyltransferase involved in cell wall biosynthesis
MSDSPTKPRFIIIMPSYLGPYKTAASKRDEKIHRAIRSVINQSFKDFELFVIADGCEKTFKILKAYWEKAENIKCSLIEKQPHLSGNVRNFGINHCTGEYICYLDIDDYFGKDHLQILNDELNINGNPDWAYFDIYEWSTRLLAFHPKKSDVLKKNQHGTGNLVHKKSLNLLWKSEGYQHDYFFVQDLLKVPDYKKLATPQYYCCHIPGYGGYDI